MLRIARILHAYCKQFNLCNTETRNFQVSISTRKVLAHWVRLGRQVLKETGQHLESMCYLQHIAAPKTIAYSFGKIVVPCSSLKPQAERRKHTATHGQTLGGRKVPRLAEALFRWFRHADVWTFVELRKRWRKWRSQKKQKRKSKLTNWWICFWIARIASLERVRHKQRNKQRRAIAMVLWQLLWCLNMFN